MPLFLLYGVNSMYKWICEKNKGFHLMFCWFWLMLSTVSGQEIFLKITNDTAYFTAEADTILVYRATETSLNGSFKRANYIHPLYGLEGGVITEDFPEDHPHHRGVFWAWHQLYVGNTRIGDGWELEDMAWDVISMDQIISSESSKTLQTEVLWKSPLWKDEKGNKKPLVKETAHITVHQNGKNFRVVDFQIELLGLEPYMRLGGSGDEKGYGGFSIRMKLPDDVRFQDKDGEVQPQNTPVKADAWLTISGSSKRRVGKTSVTLIPHKGNPGYPNPWILRTKASMQNAVFPHPGAIPISLSTTTPLRLRYRMLIANKPLKNKQIQRCRDSFFGEK